MDEYQEFECSIAVRVRARNWQEAANEAQDVIDNNTDLWVFDVTNLDTMDARDGIAADRSEPRATG